MSDISTALIPILALILSGFCIKQTKFIPEESWTGLEKLTYFIFFPALLIQTLGRQNNDGMPWTSILFVVAGTLSTAALTLILWKKIKYHRKTDIPDPTFTSIFQGGVRFNTYITLAVAQAFFGQQGLITGAVVAGFMIVLINFLCISAFSIWGENAQNGIKPFIKEILTNPLILSCAAGWFLSLSNIGLSSLTESTLEIIGRAALPFGLMAVGASLNLKAVPNHLNSITAASLVQFGIKPLMAVLLISVTHLADVTAGVIIISFMTPTAPSGYILARQLGGDTETISSIITFQTLLAFFLMPAIAFLVF